MEGPKINLRLNKGKKIIPVWVPFALVLLKILYMASVHLMLPEMTNLWSFHKSVNWFLVFAEIPIFLIVLYVYLGTQKRGSLYGCISTMLFIMYFIPNNCGLSLSNYDPLYFSLVNAFCLVLFGVIRYMVSKEMALSDTQVDFEAAWKNKKMIRRMRIIVVVACAIVLAYVYSYNGIDFSYFKSAMYETRAEYVSFTVNIQGSLLSYIILLITKTGTWMMLVCIYFSIMAKKPLDVFLCLFTYLALFTVEMQKSTLVVLAIVAFVAWQERRGKLAAISISIIKAFIALFVVIFAEYILFGTSFLFRFTANRMFYTPAYLTNVYYEFFSSTSKLWFTQDAFLIQNILGSLGGRTQPANMIKLISENAFSGLIASPNTGLFAEAYAQIGALGIIVYPFIFGMTIKIMQESARWYGKGADVVIMCQFSLTLLNTQILTSGNVIGIVLFAIIAYFFVKSKNQKKIRNEYSLTFNKERV